MRVGLFVPCFVDLFYPEVAISTVELLERLGVEVAYPEEQTCCGQAHFNAGYVDETCRLARRFCRIFAPFDAIVCPSASCTAMVRTHYPALVGDSRVPSRVFELCEYLVEHVGVTDLGARLGGSGVLHVGCHGLRQLGTRQHAEALLRNVVDLRLLPVTGRDWCCGFGGTFSVKFPEVATAMGERKLAPIAEADPDYLLSTDSSCLMHLGGLLKRSGQDRPQLLHVAQVLASSTGVR